MEIKEIENFGIYGLNLKRIDDSRGYFERTFCAREFEHYGLCARVSQSNHSFSRYPGTTRGLHYQIAPEPDRKTIFCIKGSVALIVVNVMKDHPNFMGHRLIELNSHDFSGVHIPEGFANGIQTLTENVELIYYHSEFYNPTYERGLNILDPKLSIRLPMTPAVMSEKDKSWDFL